MGEEESKIPPDRSVRGTTSLLCAWWFFWQVEERGHSDGQVWEPWDAQSNGVRGVRGKQ